MVALPWRKFQSGYYNHFIYLFIYFHSTKALEGHAVLDAVRNITCRTSKGDVNPSGAHNLGGEPNIN